MARAARAKTQQLKTQELRIEGAEVPGAKAEARPKARSKARAHGSSGTGDTTPSVTSAAGPEPTLRILDTRVLRGANYWAREPVVRMLVDLGTLEDHPSNTIPGFVDALLELLPSLEDHACSLGRRGGFLTRLRDGTWAGHVAEHIALELQNLAGTDVRHGKTRGAGPHGQYNVIYEYREEAVGIEAGKIAVALVNHLVDPSASPDFDLLAELERLIRLAERQAFGPSTQALIDEAISRDIPFIRLDRYSLVQLGQGVHQQRIRATMTSRTPAIAVDIASDKSLTNKLLDSAGLPVPRAEVVETEDEAVEAAGRLGFPCVVKPLDGNHGRGVALDLRSGEAVREGFAGALRESRSGDVVVETFIAGNDYRVLVIGGVVAAVAERVPASVVGDGVHTVRELVEVANQDPRRGIGHEKVLTRITIDAAAEGRVAAQGFELDGVPPEGARVKLALTGNMSTGGTSIDRTLEAHPDNVEIAETAARIVGLDVAGIDFICPDIATPVRETGGAIVEVNAAPGFRMHTHPTEGEPQYVAKPVIDGLFPSGTPARIPILAVTGTNGKTTTVRMMAHILKLMGKRVGMTSTDGIVVDGRLDQAGRHERPEVGPDGAPEPDRRHRRLRGRSRGHPARGPWLRPQRRGGRDQRIRRPPRSRRDHVARPAGQRQGRHRRGCAPSRHRRPQRRRPARRPDGSPLLGSGGLLLDADREGRGGLRPGRRAPRAWGRRVLPPADGRGRAHRAPSRLADDARALHPPHPGDLRRAGADEHRQLAGRGRRRLVRWRPPARYPAGPADVHDLVLPGAGSAQPARGRRRQVVIDYCHNVDGMRALAEFVTRMMEEPDGGAGRRTGSGKVGARTGRAIGVLGIPGDRRDEDQQAYGAVAATAFDEIIVREDKRLRGRKPGESAANVVAGAKAARAEGARAAKAETVLEEMAAVRAALQRAVPGDLVVMCVDDAVGVYREAMALAGAPRGATAFADPGELEAPEG